MATLWLTASPMQTEAHVSPTERNILAKAHSGLNSGTHLFIHSAICFGVFILGQIRRIKYWAHTDVDSPVSHRNGNNHGSKYEMII